MASEAVCVSPPDVPVNVAVDDPAAVPVAAANVSVAAVPGVSVREDGCAVTPAGKPVIAIGTLEENPFCAVASTETVAAVPFAVNVTVAGMRLSEKPGGSPEAACTESEPWVLAVWPLTVVVNVTVAVVVVAEEAAVSVSGRLTPGVSDSVAGETVTPVGSPDTATVAAPAPAGAARSREACCTGCARR